MPALPSWLTEPLWDQFAALLPERPEFDPSHPLGCHRRRIDDRIVFDKLLQVLRFGCSYEGIADATCSATTIRNRRDEWIDLGVFAAMKRIALEAYDRIVGLVLDEIAVDGAITKAPGGGQAAGRSPVDRGKQGMKRSGMTDGYGIPLGRILAGANRHDSPLLAPTLDLLNDFGPLPDQITIHLDAGYDSGNSRTALAERGLHGRIARKGVKAPIQATQRWHVERTHAWQNAFQRLARCYERRTTVIDAFFDLADTIITIRSLIRPASTVGGHTLMLIKHLTRSGEGLCACSVYAHGISGIPGGISGATGASPANNAAATSDVQRAAATGDEDTGRSGPLFGASGTPPAAPGWPIGSSSGGAGPPAGSPAFGQRLSRLPPLSRMDRPKPGHPCGHAPRHAAVSEFAGHGLF